MISMLLPSRGRPENITRLWQSVVDTAEGEWEMIVRLDDDDVKYPKHRGIKYIHGPRDVLSKNWNECYKVAKGPYFMHCGDDIIFRTKGWDTMVINAFPEDKIAFVHGDDGYWGQNFGTHGFLHKNWVDVTGYFVPPYFSSDYNDTWLNDVANLLGRRAYIAGMLTEHMHFAFNKGPLDQTHRDRLERGLRDGVDDLYRSDRMIAERQADADKLRKVMSV